MTRGNVPPLLRACQKLRRASGGASGWLMGHAASMKFASSCSKVQYVAVFVVHVRRLMLPAAFVCPGAGDGTGVGARAAELASALV